MLTYQDLLFVLSDEFQNVLDFTMFDFIPETPNDAIQECIQEKVRIFNNSALPLFDNYTAMTRLYEQTKEIPWDNPNCILCRQYIRQTYLELFVYREKLIRFLADLYHLNIRHQRIGAIYNMVKNKSIQFSFMSEVIVKIDSVKHNEQYILFDSIRNDEVHNITRIDRLNYVLLSSGRIKSVGYKMDSIYFIQNLTAVLNMMVEIKDEIQKILHNKYLSEINKVCKISKDMMEDYHATNET